MHRAELSLCAVHVASCKPHESILGIANGFNVEYAMAFGETASIRSLLVQHPEGVGATEI